jgi:type II secretory pathway component PulK
MKLPTFHRRCRRRPRRSRTRGSAVLVVMILLAVLAVFVAVNTQTLHQLKAELKLIEQKQQARYGQGQHH